MAIIVRVVHQGDPDEKPDGGTAGENDSEDNVPMVSVESRRRTPIPTDAGTLTGSRQWSPERYAPKRIRHATRASAN